jgi:hypothetical protein
LFVGRIKSFAQPEGLEASTMNDFFDFKFTTLPHKILQADAFNTEVDKLKLRYVLVLVVVVILFL